jgi:uncharacterized protein (TIGR03083 family)
VYEWIIFALGETWQEVRALLVDAAPSDFELPTACEGWNVRDVLSHLIGFELMMQGHALPDAPLTMPPYVRNSIGEINQRFVEANRDVAPAALLEQFAQVAEASLSRLRLLDEEQWNAVGWSPEGDVAYHRFQETRLLDSWIHLHDIRDALGCTSDVNGVAAEVVVNRFEGALAYVVGKRAQATESSTVRINLVGVLARTVSLAVLNGRASAVDYLEEPPTVEMTLPVALFWRRMAGRLSSEKFLAASDILIAGDRDLAQKIVERMNIMI